MTASFTHTNLSQARWINDLNDLTDLNDLNDPFRFPSAGLYGATSKFPSMTQEIPSVSLGADPSALACPAEIGSMVDDTHAGDRRQQITSSH